jgi:hypothetical protein
MLIKEIKAEIKKYKNKPKITGLKKKELLQVLQDLQNNNKTDDVEGGAFFNVKLDYREQAKANLYAHGTKIIKSIEAVRTPIMNVINKTLNVLSFGMLNKLKSKYGYDQLFHLGIVVVLEDDTKLVIEKLEKISISKFTNSYIKSNSEVKRVDMKLKRLSLFDLMNNARRKIGDTEFFSYDGTGKRGTTNNCQDFIINLLKYSGLENTEIYNFVKQELDQLLQKMPKYIHSISKGTTDLANKATQLIGLGKDITDLKNY